MKKLTIQQLKSYFHITGFFFKSNYNYINSITENNVMICLCDKNNTDLKLKFLNVSGFKINELCSNYSVRIEIFDVRDDQLEGKNFWVNEIENGMFSMYCEKVLIDNGEV